MNVCLIGKYPPIEGQVSTQTFWTARGLAARGHGVYVITNAGDVDAPWRMEMSERDYDGGYYQGPVGASGGFVHVIDRRIDPGASFHIPMTPLTVSRLAAAATEVVRAHACDVIFGIYLEPYGLAAHLASSWTSKPYVVMHAGTDLFRLARLAEIRTACIEVLKSASAILSGPAGRHEIETMGIDAARIVSHSAFGPPAGVFRPVITTGAPANDSATEPVLGMYGKIAEAKGSFDVLQALALLHRRGKRLRLRAMVNGHRKGQFIDESQRLGVARLVEIEPFVPNWRVPAFLHRCRAIVNVERHFEISAHAPLSPREVIACGVPLILSRELARKQPFVAAIRNGRNIIVIADPGDHDRLADAIWFALEDAERARAIGARGRLEFDLGPTYDSWIADVESVLLRVAASSSAACVRGKSAPVSPFARAYPLTSGYLSARSLTKLDAAVRAAPHSPARLERVLAEATKTDCDASVAEAVRALHAYEGTAESWRRSRTTSGAREPDELTFPNGLTLRDRVAVDCRLELVRLAFNLRAVVQHQPADICGSSLVAFSDRSEPLILGERAFAALMAVQQRGATMLSEIAETTGDRTTTATELTHFFEALYWSGIVAVQATSRRVRSA